MSYLIQNRKLERFLMLILITAFVLAASPVLAEGGEKSWQPQPPMPDTFDWIQLTSGEWLKGKITAMYEEKLEFDSKELDELTIDWEDIKEIRSAGTMQIGFQQDVVATGQLLVEGNTVRVMGEEDQFYSRSDLLTITAGAPKEINYWSGKLTLGANIREGNTDQLEFSTEANFKRRTPRNRVNFDYLGNFNRTFGEVAADNQRANAGWDKFFSKRFFWTPVYGEYYRDPFQNIASRWTLGMGVGYTLIDTKKTDWEISGGLAYQTTQFDDVLEGESDSADTPRPGIRHRLRLRYHQGHRLHLRLPFLHRERGIGHLHPPHADQSRVRDHETARFRHHLGLGPYPEPQGGLEWDHSRAGRFPADVRAGN